MLEFFNKLTADNDDVRWEKFSSFYMSVKTDMEVSFNDASLMSTDIGMLKNLIGDIPDHVKE
jgi:hypothetical protein